MKLISLYIENFGGLSQYALTFSEGVTVIEEPNGFGKTTLAEFIRAMFYGFPRKSKTLDKNRRQKYMPWNGGTCGGNLVFSLDGNRYRIERSFGATPKGDTFKLVDLQTNRKSDRFSEEIGVELFQLDADSFERSTYCPQLHDSGSLTTNTIQAKLTHLVEDTGDINNFDKAMERLRNKRSGFVPYRGSGGTVAQARGQILKLQQELDELGGTEAALEQCNQCIVKLEQTQQQTEQEVASVRRLLTAASEAAASEARNREYRQLSAQRTADITREEQLRHTYPAGIPEPEEIEQAEGLSRQLEILTAQQVSTTQDEQARQFVQEHRGMFADGVPDEVQLEKCLQQYRRYERVLTALEGATLSEQEQAQYETLCVLAQTGMLSDETLEKLSDEKRELEKLHQNAQLLRPEAEDTARLESLRQLFRAGVPDARELEQQRMNLQTCRQLRQQVQQMQQSVETPQRVQKKSSPVMPILALLAGLAGCGVGIVLLIQKGYVGGGICLGAGVLALIGAVFLGLRMMLHQALSGGTTRLNPQVQAQLEEDQARLQHLEQELSDFVRHYGVAGDVDDGLREIEAKAADLKLLSRRMQTLEEKRREILHQAQMLETALTAQLAQRANTAPDLEKAIQQLYVEKEQFLSLREKMQSAMAQKAALQSEADQLQEMLSRFLKPYYPQAEPSQFEALLTQLQRDGTEYQRCMALLEDEMRRKQAQTQAVQECNCALDAFFERNAMARQEDLTRQFRQMGSDGKEWSELKARRNTLDGRLQELEAQGAAQQVQMQQDPQQLKMREKQLNEMQTELTQQLLQQRQTRVQLRGQVDRIPEIQDELSRWQEQRQADQGKADLLDATMDFLQRARDQLSSSYLGPIREHFSHYLHHLTGENGEQVLISPELEVQLERMGQARELAFFSAGQTDLVMLCMRLALVDALFGDAKPFVILDDPFVNLDDNRTAQALQLLQELGEERQILYLVCNSSRSF